MSHDNHDFIEQVSPFEQIRANDTVSSDELYEMIVEDDGVNPLSEIAVLASQLSVEYVDGYMYHPDTSCMPVLKEMRTIEADDPERYFSDDEKKRFTILTGVAYKKLLEAADDSDRRYNDSVSVKGFFKNFTAGSSLGVGLANVFVDVVNDETEFVGTGIPATMATGGLLYLVLNNVRSVRAIKKSQRIVAEYKEMSDFLKERNPLLFVVAHMIADNWHNT